ncbi:phage tail protein [Serratia marcescens]|uniref:Phage tail fibre protein N-terminal domain-containing protein n=1 Tax=Serratia marcescens TaxID=615 RepID=A0A380A2V0_SERMA|nr:phage tail protein [Serratia marcescens]KFD11642.1 phage tail fiber protein [Serratia marcescens subsp. marcescens ATCC 13880]KFL04568.1 phage tail-collar fiber family protein [Serratia marcescens]MCC3249446.1 phage tail protein [Serratia marcescens]PNU46135.1 phage tail protein [Serratia marcescens subsp. marcescens ATCC 13880]QDL85520.1 phage tail protein [Serratia marcescens subsp. marcescens ATCC 13880]
MGKFFSIITNRGAEKIAAAAAIGEKLSITVMAVGDGLGTLPQPHPEQTQLLNERYRADINSLNISNADQRVIAVDMVIPANIGGWWMREIGVYDNDGDLIAVANMPETYKPLLDEGSGRLQIIRMELMVSSTADVELIVDPDVIIAPVTYVDNKFNEAKGRADDAYALAENKAAFDDIYPPGISIFFATNLNPNEKWPGTTWHYTGENKTIRIGKADGSDVGAEGGSDTVNITRANLPQSVLNVSGSTNEQGAQTLQTTPAGRHRHQGGMSAPGETWDDDYIVGSDNDSRRTRNYTSEAEDHTHEATVPPHSHTVWAQTEALGQGQAINVVESHIKLMCWYRAA